MAATTAALLLTGCAQAPEKRSAAASTTCAILHPIPPPQPLYRGTDVDVRVEQTRSLSNQDVVVRLRQRIAANPRDVDALIQRGYEYAQRQQRAWSEADFARAQALAPDRTRVYWSQGWALYALGDSACAIEAWQHAAGMLGGDMTLPANQRSNVRLGVGGDAFWVPYTLAIGYWAVGEHDVALDYYSAAVRSFPERFVTLNGLNAYTRNWKPRERTTIHDVAKAWLADGKQNRPDTWAHHGDRIAPLQ